MKGVFHINSFEPIRERPTSKLFHEPSVQSVTIDVIGTFWREKTRELYHIDYTKDHLKPIFVTREEL